MGFWQKVGDSIKDGAKNISDEIKKRQEIAQTKKQILHCYELNDLRKICKNYGIGEPLPYEVNPISGVKEKRTVTREHFINRIMDRLTLDQIQTFSDKNRIKTGNIGKPIISNTPIRESVQEQPLTSEHDATTPGVERSSEFDAILNTIKNYFEPEDVRDENDFEKQLTQFLKIKYPNRVKRQVETPKGKIDLVIDEKYAIELKIADGKGKLRDLVGQVHSYKKVFNSNVAVILLDVGMMPHSEIKEYIDDYEGLNVKTLVLEGILRRRKGTSKRTVVYS